MKSETARVALTKTLRDGRTAVITVNPRAALWTAETIATVDGQEYGRHAGPHHAAAPDVLARAGAVAAVGRVLLTEAEARQVTDVYREVCNAIPGMAEHREDVDREWLVRRLDGAEADLGAEAAERMDAGYPDPFTNPAGEQRLADARTALAEFDAAHPGAVARAAAKRDAMVRRVIEGGL